MAASLVGAVLQPGVAAGDDEQLPRPILLLLKSVLWQIKVGERGAMLSLKLTASFLPPGRFFPPQHMVGPTVLTYLLSCGAYPTAK